MAWHKTGVPTGPGRGIDRFLERVGTLLGRSPARITLVYLAFGSVALVFSDALLPAVLTGETLARVQAVKGAVEVALTAGLVYLLTSTGRASLQRTTAEAERQRKEIQILHRVLRHNLRNNLTLVLGNARTLRSRLSDPSKRAICNEAITAAKEIRRWTQQAGQIRRLANSPEPVELDLAEVVPSVVASADRVDETVTIETDVPEHAPIRASPQFEIALEELVANAIEHNEVGDPTVRVSVDRTGPLTTLEIADDGPGFPEHVLAVMAGADDQIVHLDGLGLWLVYLVVSRSDGELTIENAADGARVRIDVPSA